jgi:hypothetical protein
MKIRPVGAVLLHEDGRTDMTNRTLAFRTFAKAPKMQLNPAVNEVPNMALQMRCDVTVFQQSLPNYGEKCSIRSRNLYSKMRMDVEGFFETLVSIKLNAHPWGP